MEESDLLKERLQAITEKYRIQEDIRQKKLELDQEKLKLQHLKKKTLREQWLLQDSASHNTIDCPKQQHLVSDQHQTRALQLNIHRIELEVESLEREESVISTNESFIINRLKAVEKSPEEIIKEAQDSFVPEPIRVPTLVPDVPESPSPPASQHYELSPRKTLFAMEINVSKNLLTGESAVLSTATVPPEELNHHAGLKVYDDGRKCVYALSSQEASHNQSCLSELSASEVEMLLKSATLHRQMNHQNYSQSQSRRDLHCFYDSQDEQDGDKRCDLRQQEGHFGQQPHRQDTEERDFHCGEDWWKNQEDEHSYGHYKSYYRGQDERNNHGNLRGGHHVGNHNRLGCCYDNQKHCPYTSKDKSHQSINFQSAHENHPAGHHINGTIRSNSRVSGGRVNGHPPPISHDQEEVSAYQSQLCYTPDNHIPLSDYISVDEEQLYCFKQPSYHSHDVNAPSPLYRDDVPYTILNAMDTTEPITAIFMGFQTAQDDSGQCHQFDGSLQAELVILEDNEENSDDSSMKEQRVHSQLGCHNYPRGCLANGNITRVEGDKQMERPAGPDEEGRR